MKNLILSAVIILFSVSCFGQKLRIGHPVDPQQMLYGNSYFEDKVTHGSGWFYEREGLDTIPIVLLISDTAIIAFTITNYHRLERSCDTCFIHYGEDTTRSVNYSPFVIKAYSVRTKDCCVTYFNGHNWDNDSKPEFIYTHLYYLDDKKQPLSPSIVVWISKEIKNGN